MAAVAMDELCKRRKAQTIKLIEIADITRRAAEAFERRDEVSIRVLLDEREEPVRQLRELEEGVRGYLLTLPQAEAIRCRELLDGAEPEAPEEKPLAEQTAQFRRILESVLAIDKQLSLRMGGEKSFYRTFRE